MPPGGPRPGSGRPKGRKDDYKRVMRSYCAQEREIQDALIRRTQGTARDPVEVLLDICTDKSEPSLVRVMAAKAAAPYIRQALPSVAAVTHAHVSVDKQTLLDGLSQRLERLREAPQIEAQAEPVAVAEAAD